MGRGGSILPLAGPSGHRRSHEEAGRERGEAEGTRRPRERAQEEARPARDGGGLRHRRLPRNRVFQSSRWATRRPLHVDRRKRCGMRRRLRFDRPKEPKVESPAALILRTWADRWGVRLEDVFGPPERASGGHAAGDEPRKTLVGRLRSESRPHRADHGSPEDQPNRAHLPLDESEGRAGGDQDRDDVDEGRPSQLEGDHRHQGE